MQKIIYILVVKMHRGNKILFRKAYKDINNRYNSSNKKALLIDGARQISKTYLIREFLKENAVSYIEFNLYENDLVKQAFETISAFATKPLIKEKTIIFIDEIQAVSEVVTKVKFLIEECSYRYIFSFYLLNLLSN